MVKDQSNIVLHVGPGEFTQGGISSVLNFFKNISFWKDFNCFLISTHADGGLSFKVKIYFSAILKFFKYINRVKLVHFHISWHLSLIRDFPFIFFSFVLRKKIILHVHSGFEPIKFSNFYFLYKLCFKLSDKVIFLSESILNEFYYDLGYKYNFLVIPNSIKINSSFSSEKEKHILFLGHIKDSKGIFHLVEAFSKFNKIYPDWKLYIGGSGDLNSLDKLSNIIVDNNLEDSCLYLGWLDYSSKMKYLNSSSIFCLPSLTEGFPMSVLEAWSMKNALICTYVGGLKYYLKDGWNCIIVDFANVDDIFNSLIRLNNSDYLMKYISENGKITFISDFSPDIINRAYLELYSKII